MSSAASRAHTDYNLVILVDENDREIGTLDKLEAHKGARLHRAISVILKDTEGNWLVQQRAKHKYHCPQMWTNTCCTHPLPGETNQAAAVRRLNEEMGLAAELNHAFSFVYYASLPNGLTEHEYDHVFTGVVDTPPSVNPVEVMAWRWVAPAVLAEEMRQHPEWFTPWFKLLFQRMRASNGK